MKTNKSYRFDELTVMILGKLSEEYRKTETELIQSALFSFASEQLGEKTMSELIVKEKKSQMKIK